MWFMRHSVKLIAVIIIAGSFFGGHVIYRSLSRDINEISCPKWYNPEPSYIRVELKNSKFQDPMVAIRSKGIIVLSKDDDGFFRSKKPIEKSDFEISVFVKGKEVFSKHAENRCGFTKISADMISMEVEVSCYPCATGV